MRDAFPESSYAPCAASPHLHPVHVNALFLGERSRREGIRGSLSTLVAAIPFAVFAFGRLAVEVDVERWRELPTMLILLLGATAAVALFASARQVLPLHRPGG